MFGLRLSLNTNFYAIPVFALQKTAYFEEVKQLYLLKYPLTTVDSLTKIVCFLALQFGPFILKYPVYSRIS